MIQLLEETISCSDNSHLFGMPFVIREEHHALLKIQHKDLPEWIEKTVELPVEFHFSW